MTSSKIGQKGTTLIEVMGSVMVFMIGVTAMMSVYLASMRMSKESGYAYTAFNLAKKHIETLRATSFNDLAVAAEQDVVLDAEGNADPDGEYHRSTTVTTPYSGHADLARVTVSVQYTLHGTLNATPTQLTTVIMG